MHQGETALQDGHAIEAIVRRAIDGDEDAFRDLYARHAGLTWRFAYALTGTREDAVTVTSESFARTFTALRGAAGARPDFSTLLLQTTRNAALDVRRSHGDDLPPFEATEQTLDLARAFASLPERWRSALWLGVVERAEQAQVARTIELSRDDTARIVSRARKGLREQYLRAEAGRGDSRNCERAIARLSPYVAGTLRTGDIDKLERHLRLCAACDGRYARLATALDRLPQLVPALPDMLEDDVRLAWSGAVATASNGLGISQFGEKVLAGVAAFAAGVGVLGAALVSVSGSGGDDVAVSPIAPLVAELAAPRPEGLDLSIDLDPDGTGSGGGTGGTSGALDGRDDVDSIRPVSNRSDGAPVVTDLGDAPSGDADGPGDAGTPPIGGGDGGDDGPTTPTPPTDGPTTTAPVVSVGVDLGDLPVAIEVGNDPGLTVGPISVGSQPTPGDDTISVGGALEPLAPVVDPVNDVVNGLLGG